MAQQQQEASQLQLATTSPVKKGLTKLANILDQGMDDEIPTVTDTAFQEGYSAHKEKMGALPPIDEEPSIEQFSALRHLLEQKSPPYADFIIFGPRALRIRKRLRLSGFQISASGSLEKSELFGPASHAEWAKSYAVLSTALSFQRWLRPGLPQ